MKYILLFVTLGLSQTAFAQYILDEFNTTVSAHDLKADSNGNYYLAGLNYYVSNQSGIVAKYDSTGTLLWESKWGDDLHLVGDIVLSDNGLFGAVSGWEGDEWVFELDTETGDVIWQSAIETYRERDGASGGIDAQLWLDHGHVMVNTWLSGKDGIDVRRIYCFTRDSGTLKWFEDFTSPYGMPMRITVGREDKYSMPMGYSADSLIEYSFSQNHSIFKADFSDYPLDSNGVQIKWDRFDSRLRKFHADSNLVFDEPLLVDTTRIKGLNLYSSAQFEEKIMFTSSVTLNDSIGYGWYQAVYDLNFGTQLWDTLFVFHDGYEFRDLAYANGFLYSFGYTMDSIYVFTPKVFRLNVDFLNVINGGSEFKQEELSFQLYPNPTSSTLNINFEQAEQATIGIYSLTGALLLERKVNTQNVQLDVSGLPKDMYLMRVKTTERAYSQKVVIE